MTVMTFDIRLPRRLYPRLLLFSFSLLVIDLALVVPDHGKAFAGKAGAGASVGGASVGAGASVSGGGVSAGGSVSIGDPEPVSHVTASREDHQMSGHSHRGEAMLPVRRQCSPGRRLSAVPALTLFS